MQELNKILMAFYAVLFIIIVLTCSATAQAQNQSSCKEFNPEEDEVEASEARGEYERIRLIDPSTGIVPLNIRANELQFASKIQSPINYLLSKNNTTFQSENWVSRGPANIGARSRALGIDVSNEDIILAGGTTGGMWRSTDRGVSWVRTSPLSVMPSTTCLAQDIRSGKTDTWYYGTGEVFGNTAAYPMWKSKGPLSWGDYYGNGIYKSIDNGLTWNILPATSSDNLGSLTNPFNFVNNIVVDPSNSTEDVLYAAVSGGIERSSNGGTSWSMVLGDFPNGSACTDIAVTSSGIVYAILGSITALNGLPESTNQGIYRSTDGINWVNITPAGWQGAKRYVSLAIAPSNENVVYAASDATESFLNLLWKYTYLSGDGTGKGGVYEDRSLNLYSTNITFVVYVKVKPDDENTVFVGGLTLRSSTDGFATSDHISEITPPHIDQVSMSFFPSNPDMMIVGCDGGLFLTLNNLISPIQWVNLNNGYVTTQFYTIAIDHESPGDMTIIGGLQDNGTILTNSSDLKKPWININGADGSFCAIAGGRTSYFDSYQFGVTWRKVLDKQGKLMYNDRIDPIGSTQYLFLNPFCLDPNNSDCMYFGGGSFLWRNDSLPEIPYVGSRASTSIGWTKLYETTVVPIDILISLGQISAITASKIPANRVYYGTSDGQVFRLDSSDKSDPMPIEIWKSKGLPSFGYVTCIAVDQLNSDNAILAFANYNVQSLFFTSDAGITWTPIGGNLEEYPDGKGNGPSIRTAAIMHSGDGFIYLVGTSTGLYSTTNLDGMSTVWSLEGASTIGNNIVNMIDTRESDGMVAVATCGHGVFSGSFEPATGIREDVKSALNIQNYPNPSSGLTTIEYSITETAGVSISITNSLGIELVGIINNRMHETGDYSINCDASNLPNGVYFLTIKAGNRTETKKFVVIR